MPRLLLRSTLAVALAVIIAPLANGCAVFGEEEERAVSTRARATATFSSNLTTGIATFYDANGDGSCSFGPSGDLDVAAFNMGDFAESASCGSCLEVSGPNGAITIRIVDSCPGCEEHHLDLSASAFAKIADPKAGRVPIKYRSVACNVSGPLSYKFKEGSHDSWTAIQIRNHKLPITKVEAKKGGEYRAMKRADYNYFIDDEGLKDSPIVLRITAADGQIVEDTLPGAKGGGGKTFSGVVQFK